MVKNPPANVEDISSIPGSARPTGERNGNSKKKKKKGKKWQFTSVFLPGKSHRRSWQGVVDGVAEESNMT